MNEVTGDKSNNDNLTTPTTNQETDSSPSLINDQSNPKNNTEGRTDGSADINSRKRKIDDEESQSEKSSENKETDRTTLPGNQECDSNALYGLPLRFLKSLEIIPPIDQWIQFRCDKSELRDVLELAGRVVLCAVITKQGKIAKVMYSHPLEAVQAVSMFHGQIFYGQKLNVCMMACPSDSVMLPKGLNNIGPGLGKSGKPLRNVAEQYEHFLEHKPSSLDPILFLHPDGSPSKKNDGISVKSFAYDSRPLSLINVFNVDEDLEEARSSNKKSRTIGSKPYVVCANITLTDSENSGTDTESLDLTLDDNETRSSAPANRSERNPATRALKPANSSAPPITRTLKPVIPTVSQPQNPVPRNFPPRPHNNMEVRPHIDVRAPMFMQGPMNPMMPGTMPASRPNMNMGHPGMSGPYRPPNGPFPGQAQMVTDPILGPIYAPSGNPVPPAGSMPPAGPMPPAPNIHLAGPMHPPGTMPPGGSINPVGPMPAPTPSGAPMSAASPVSHTVPGSVTLHFRNLPPTTTFALLSEKVSLCGQVLSLLLTTPGCAVAVFAVRSDAERCYRFFHGKCIDGCVVEVCIVG